MVGGGCGWDVDVDVDAKAVLNEHSFADSSKVQFLAERGDVFDLFPLLKLKQRAYPRADLPAGSCRGRSTSLLPCVVDWALSTDQLTNQIHSLFTLCG